MSLPTIHTGRWTAETAMKEKADAARVCLEEADDLFPEFAPVDGKPMIQSPEDARWAAEQLEGTKGTDAERAYTALYAGTGELISPSSHFYQVYLRRSAKFDMFYVRFPARWLITDLLAAYLGVEPGREFIFNALSEDAAARFHDAVVAFLLGRFAAVWPNYNFGYVAAGMMAPVAPYMLSRRNVMATEALLCVDLVQPTKGSPADLAGLTSGPGVPRGEAGALARLPGFPRARPLNDGGYPCTEREARRRAARERHQERRRLR